MNSPTRWNIDGAGGADCAAPSARVIKFRVLGAVRWFAPGHTQHEDLSRLAGKRVIALLGNGPRARPPPRAAILLPSNLLLQPLSAYAPGSIGGVYEGPTASALATMRLLALVGARESRLQRQANTRKVRKERKLMYRRVSRIEQERGVVGVNSQSKDSPEAFVAVGVRTGVCTACERYSRLYLECKIIIVRPIVKPAPFVVAGRPAAHL